MKNWDGVYTKNSPAAAIFEQFYINFAENLAKDEMGKKLYGEYTSSDILIRNLVKNVWNHPESPWCDDVRTENKKEGFSDIVQNSFIEAVDTLSEQMGEEPERWQWGNIHQLTLSHPIGGEVPVVDMIFNMNRGPFKLGGGPHTVCAYDYSFSSSFSFNTGPSQRHVYSLANWDSSRTVIPTGTSGIPSSRYYFL
ncbi:MAG: penicillin acylase family protein, partial [Bacteroidales bacterium]|nr:penicillin acylase family protein [Bacteroidales bacterium]